MHFLDNSIRSINYTTTLISQTVNRVIYDHLAVKKALQVSSKIMEIYDWYKSKDYYEISIKNLEGTIDLINFYITFRNIIYWIHPFSKESFDQQVFLGSIKNLLDNLNLNINIDEKNKINQVDQIFNEVIRQEAYYSKGEVRHTLKNSLIIHGFTPQVAEEIVKQVIIKQKKEPLIKSLIMVCYTLKDLGNNLITLKKWELFDLAKDVGCIGRKSRLITFLIHLGFNKVLGTIDCVGLILVLGEAGHRFVTAYCNRYEADRREEKERNVKQLKTAFYEILTSSVDLIYTAVPLLVPLRNPTIIFLAIFAKGTGLVCLLLKNN